VVIAAAAAYTHRLTGAHEIILGLPVPGRVGKTARRVPGPMMNTVPLRLSLHPKLSLVDLVQQVAQEVRQTLRHQRYRGEALRRDLQRSGSNQRLFWSTGNVIAVDCKLRCAGHNATSQTLESGPIDD